LTDFAKTGAFLINLAIDANKKGDYFPVWGTCLGYELIVLTVSNDTNIFDNYDSSNHAMSV